MPNPSNSGQRGASLPADTTFGFGDNGTAPPGGEVATVWLNSLTATPGSVVPFQAATIAWDVHSDAHRVRIELNGDPVGQTGSRVVTPRSSSVYRITATTPNASRELGRVSVGVDSQACVTYQALNIPHVLNGAWESGLESNENFSLTQEPKVTLANGKVHLRADFKFDLPDLPVGKGTGSIRASFRIGVADREVVTASEAIDVDLKLPVWARWLAEAAGTPVETRLASARLSATQDVRDAIGGMAQLIGSLGAPELNMALVSAQVAAGQGGVDGFIFTACPDEPLGRLIGPGEALQGKIEPRIVTDAPSPT